MHTLSGKKQNQTKPVGERRGHSREIRRSRDAATVELRRAMLLRPRRSAEETRGRPRLRAFACVYACAYVCEYACEYACVGV